MTENHAFVKMSARRNLSSLLGEPDREQNKSDLAYWNDFFDQQFKSRWGIDPKRDILDASVWQKVTPEDEVPSAYGMSSLEWACTTSAKKRCRRTHLGLQGARESSPVPTPAEVNTNSTTAADRVMSTVTSTVTSSVTRPLTPDNVDIIDLERSQCESPVPTVVTSSPAELSPSSIAPSSSSPPPSPQCGSRKRKQTTINGKYMYMVYSHHNYYMIWLQPFNVFTF